MTKHYQKQHKKNEKLESLQLVRALAILLVLFIHIDAFSARVLNSTSFLSIFTPGGDAGVDLFFVVSGFIIFYVHRHDINKKAQFIPYLLKRFSRIYPTYWLVNAIIIPLHFLFPQFGIGDETEPRTIINSLLLVPQLKAPIIHAAWTLVYELFFYITFGLLILFGIRKTLPLIILIIIGTIIGWFYSFNKNASFQTSYSYLIFSYHNFEFLLGCLAAYLITSRTIKYRKILLLTGVAIFSSMLMLENFTGTRLYSLRLFGYGIPSFFIITALGSYELSKSVRIPTNLLTNFLLLLGNASFSVYLTHQLLVSGIGRTLMGLGFVKILGPSITIGIVTIITVIIGCIFYQKIEKPLIYYSRTRLLSLYNKRVKLNVQTVPAE